MKRRSKSPPVLRVTSGAGQTPPEAKPNKGEISGLFKKSENLICQLELTDTLTFYGNVSVDRLRMIFVKDFLESPGSELAGLVAYRLTPGSAA